MSCWTYCSLTSEVAEEGLCLPHTKDPGDPDSVALTGLPDTLKFPNVVPSGKDSLQ